MYSVSLQETDTLKICKSDDYNYTFNKNTGFFARWGETYDDDPQLAPSPELLDLEISTSSNCSGRCPFCYKENGPGQTDYNLTYDDFCTILDKFPKVMNTNGNYSHLLTQIAFGICDIDTNPDFFSMMEEARRQGVIPNYTCNGYKITPEIATLTEILCGAVAVSIVSSEDSYDAIYRFTEAGMKQVNIHFMFSEETFEKALKLIDLVATDERLKNVNAIVFLLYKPKGSNTDQFHSIKDIDKYIQVTNKCMEKGIKFGFDSCSAPAFEKAMQGTKYERMSGLVAEPCESGLFSSYINCYGEFFVCSFAEGEQEWTQGIDVLHCSDFREDIWLHPKVREWRQKLLSNKRCCPIFDLEVRETLA